MQNLLRCPWRSHTQRGYNRWPPPPPKIIKIQPSKSSAVTPRSWKNVKNENWHIQIGYNRRQHHEIPEMQKYQNASYTIITPDQEPRKSIIWQISKMHLNVFPLEATEKIGLKIESDYHACIDHREETITVEPITNHIRCKTTGNMWDTET